jgi:hypothetical protein
MYDHTGCNTSQLQRIIGFDRSGGLEELLSTRILDPWYEPQISNEVLTSGKRAVNLCIESYANMSLQNVKTPTEVLFCFSSNAEVLCRI